MIRENWMLRDILAAKARSEAERRLLPQIIAAECMCCFRLFNYVWRQGDDNRAYCDKCRKKVA